MLEELKLKILNSEFIIFFSKLASLTGFVAFIQHTAKLVSKEITIIGEKNSSSVGSLGGLCESQLPNLLLIKKMLTKQDQGHFGNNESNKKIKQKIPHQLIVRLLGTCKLKVCFTECGAELKNNKNSHIGLCSL